MQFTLWISGYYTDKKDKQKQSSNERTVGNEVFIYYLNSSIINILSIMEVKWNLVVCVFIVFIDVCICRIHKLEIKVNELIELSNYPRIG